MSTPLWSAILTLWLCSEDLRDFYTQYERNQLSAIWLILAVTVSFAVLMYWLNCGFDADLDITAVLFMALQPSMASKLLTVHYGYIWGCTLGRTDMASVLGSCKAAFT